MRQRLSSPSRIRRPFGAEHLETRDLLAGDVTVTKSGTTLSIIAVGTAANDVVVVGSATPGTYTVFGIDLDASGDNTTINHQLKDFDAGGRTYTGIRFINVNLNGGNDNFFLTNVPASEAANRLQGLTVNMGAGNDSAVIGGPLTIDTDFVGDATVGGNIETNSGTVDLRGVATILMGAGNDSLVVRGTTSTGLINALMEAGNDSANLTDVNAQAISVNFGAGDASFTGGNLTTTTGNLTINAANGTNNGAEIAADTLAIGGSVNVTTGAGTGAISLTGGTVGGSLSAVSGNIPGRDASMTVSGIAIDHVATLITGAGDDTIEFADSTADILTIISGLGEDTIRAIFSQPPAESNQLARVASIDSGAGNDNVTVGGGETVEGGVAFDFLTVNLGDGDDNLEVSNTTVAINAFFNGGAGTDNYDDNGGTNDFQGTVTKILFETEDDL